MQLKRIECCGVYGDNVPTDKSCREMFWRFKNGDFSVEDKLRCGQPKNSKTKNWKHYLMKIRIKRKKSFKQFPYDWNSWEFMAIGFRTSWSRETSILQHVNGPSNVEKSVKTYLKTLKWEVLPHPPYSPDVTPPDHHLFQSMAHGLAHQHFKWIDSSIAKKDALFFRDGIRKLPGRWEKVVINDGQYFD